MDDEKKHQFVKYAKPRHSAGFRLGLAMLIGVGLLVPIIMVYLLISDRQNMYITATASITQGWAGPQTIAGPVLVIPYTTNTIETINEDGKQVTKTVTVTRQLEISPQTARFSSKISPEFRKRSIYQAAVYEADVQGTVVFTLPSNLEQLDINPAALLYERAELRFGLSDARGLFGDPPVVKIAGQALQLEPGNGPKTTNGSGFFNRINAQSLPNTPITVNFSYKIRGTSSITLVPQAGDTTWDVKSSWPSPSFQGRFLPVTRRVTDTGFEASYRVGNLALGQSLAESNAVVNYAADGDPVAHDDDGMSVILFQPIDLYDQIMRAVKYGILFIGFTFATLLMFDVLSGIRVSSVAYFLVGIGLTLFFVLLLAFAEIIGFIAAYFLASAAIIGLITAYSASILQGWRRATYIGGMLAGLYAMLYVLLSLEGYSLLIGALLLFAALATVMYATRNLDWGASRE